MIQKKISKKLNKYPLIKRIVSIVSHPIKKAGYYKKLKHYSEEISVLPEFKSTDYLLWKRSFKELVAMSNEERFMDMIDEFYHESLTLLKEHCFKHDDIIVVCLLKNEIYRVREFVKHYRSLGVDGFIFIDNGSEDGTVEFLTSQQDVALLKTDTTYNSVRKTAWINKVISYYGLNRWYLIPDSDEFFVYPEMDEMNIHEYLDKIMKKGIFSVKTMMLEMYPNAPFFDTKCDPGDFRATYIYFDPDTHFHQRLFGYKEKSYRPKPTALFYDGNRFALGSHEYYPFIENSNSGFGGIVLHYKFLPNERNKIEKIVESGTYANNSSLYKLYKKKFDENVKFNAYFDESLEWKGTESFNYFPFIKKLSETEKERRKRRNETNTIT